MNAQKLRELIAMPESEKLDFKLEFKLDTESSKKEFVKDVSAIANSKGGRGYIIFGVKDKTKEPVGVSACKNEEERIHQIISSRCDPPVSVAYEEIDLDGKNIAVITIYKSDYIPHQIIGTGTIYIRRGSTTDVARRTEIAGLLQDNGLLAYETVPIRQATLNDLDMKLIYKQLINKNELDDEQAMILLESLGFIHKSSPSAEYCPTAGGLLLFGKIPQRFLTSAGMRIEYEGETRFIEGNIPAMLEKSEKYISSILKNSGYPINAIYEAVYNAVVHRDYWDYSRDILVAINDKKIEIINPGALWKKEGSVRFDDDTNPPRRNNWLYQRLLLIDKRRRFLNSPYGIRTVYESFDRKNKIKFINSPKNNIFKVVLPGISEFTTDKPEAEK